MSKTILYVDDEEINLMLFDLNFKNKFNIITAMSARQGLKILKEHTVVSVVISDMRMPEMNGIEFIKKAKENYPGINYFILTGYDINKEISSALQSGLINAYFKKPFNISEIESSINEIIKD